MILDLPDSLADELRDTLEHVIGDMSSEIADTDNAGYRRGLEVRRQHLKSIRAQLGDPTAPQPSAPARG